MVLSPIEHFVAYFQQIIVQLDHNAFIDVIQKCWRFGVPIVVVVDPLSPFPFVSRMQFVLPVNPIVITPFFSLAMLPVQFRTFNDPDYGATERTKKKLYETAEEKKKLNQYRENRLQFV